MQMQYGTITPSQIFRIYRKVLDFRMDTSKHPQPQLDDLEAHYADMESSGVDVPEFVRVMTLVTHLQAPLNTYLVQGLLATVTVATSTWAATQTTILNLWDVEQSRNIGQAAKRHSAHKLSAVKKWQGPPSFHGQARPSSFPEKNKQGTKRGRPGKGAKRCKKQAIHFATTASHPPPAVHTIVHFTPQGLAQRIAVLDPSTFFFGHVPWFSFNNAMRTVDTIGASKTPRTVQRLE